MLSSGGGSAVGGAGGAGAPGAVRAPGPSTEGGSASVEGGGPGGGSDGKIGDWAGMAYFTGTYLPRLASHRYIGVPGAAPGVEPGVTVVEPGVSGSMFGL